MLCLYRVSVSPSTCVWCPAPYKQKTRRKAASKSLRKPKADLVATMAMHSACGSGSSGFWRRQRPKPQKNRASSAWLPARQMQGLSALALVIPRCKVAPQKGAKWQAQGSVQLVHFGHGAVCLLAEAKNKAEAPAPAPMSNGKASIRGSRLDKCLLSLDLHARFLQAPLRMLGLVQRRP